MPKRMSYLNIGDDQFKIVDDDSRLAVDAEAVSRRNADAALQGKINAQSLYNPPDFPERQFIKYITTDQMEGVVSAGGWYMVYAVVGSATIDSTLSVAIYRFSTGTAMQELSIKTVGNNRAQRLSTSWIYIPKDITFYPYASFPTGGYAELFYCPSLDAADAPVVDQDQELLDIRVGYDATEYDDAGTAVRSQISDLHDAVNDLAEDIAHEFSDETNYIAGDYVRRNGNLYRFTSDHAAGDWDFTEVTEVTLMGQYTDMIDVVQDWLEDHPEATTTVQDGSLTEAKFTNALKLATVKDYVTPEMFGAVGDGVADDTEAVQAALDSDTNVCLVGKYLITDTLVFNKSGQWGKNVFALTEVRWADHCQLFFDLEDRTKPCIELQSDGFTMQNVCVRGVNTRNQTFIKTNITAVDVDMSLISSSIYNFDTIVDITGRGLDMSNCVVAGCSVIAKIAWKTESNTDYHDDITGQRAYNFCNNRFHSMGKANSPLFQISSGNLYGFRFVDNNFDRGYTSILHSEANAKNWIISGNTFNGIMGYGTNNIFFGIDGDAEQVTISNNMFTQVETTTLTNQIVHIEGQVNGLVFVNNSFSEIKNVIMIYFANSIKNSILSNNMMLKNAVLSTTRGLFTFTGTHVVENTIISGNVVGETTSSGSSSYNYYIIRCSGSLTLRNVKMIGNIRPLSSVTANVKDYSIGTPTIDNCIFDWELVNPT